MAMSIGVPAVLYYQGHGCDIDLVRLFQADP